MPTKTTKRKSFFTQGWNYASDPTKKLPDVIPILTVEEDALVTGWTLIAWIDGFLARRAVAADQHDAACSGKVADKYKSRSALKKDR